MRCPPVAPVWLLPQNATNMHCACIEKLEYKNIILFMRSDQAIANFSFYKLVEKYLNVKLSKAIV
jgi:hypothetical protein